MGTEDESDFESKSHVTKHLTGNEYEITRERTRVNSWEEQDYLNWQIFLAETLKVDFYRKDAEIYMGLKISKDGLCREEDVEVLKGMYDENRGFYTGPPMVAEAIREQEREGNRPRR